jgi:hypothetical protein
MSAELPIPDSTGVAVGTYFARVKAAVVNSRNHEWLNLHRVTKVAVYASTGSLVQRAFVAFDVQLLSLEEPVHLLLERTQLEDVVEAAPQARGSELDSATKATPMEPQEFADQFAVPPPGLHSNPGCEMLCYFAPINAMSLFDVALLAYLSSATKASESNPDHSLFYAHLVYAVLLAHFGTSANEAGAVVRGGVVGDRKDETFESSRTHLLAAFKEKASFEKQGVSFRISDKNCIFTPDWIRKILEEIEAAVQSDDIDRELARLQESIRVLRAGFSRFDAPEGPVTASLEPQSVVSRKLDRIR